MINYIIVLMQENHSYDTYFGTYSGNPAGIGIPAGHNNGGHKPYHFSSLNANTHDINHDWSSIHKEWANGAMTGVLFD